METDKIELKYTCEVETCKKEVGQIIWSPEDKKWKCVKCYYKKNDTKK